MFKINHVSVCAPSEVEIRYRRVSSEVKRNVLGQAVIDFIATKRELQIKWAYLPSDALTMILDALDGGFVTVDCPLAGGAMTCYCEERSLGVRQMRDGQPVYTDIQLTLLER